MSTPRRWGIRLDGCGQGLEQLLRQHLDVQVVPEDRAYTLVEIGSANCVTLRAFTDILSETAGVKGQRWRAVGFDLTPGKAWSMDTEEVKKSFLWEPYNVIEGDAPCRQMAHQLPDGMSLLLLDDPRSYLHDWFNPSIDFCFIDGSHGVSCAHDFLAIEPKVAPGGVVVFHDYGEAEQGTDWQAADNEFINVRTYVHRLGLREPTNRLRKGWRWIAEIPGSRAMGGDGNSAAVVQRTAEPLEDHAPRPD